MFTDRDDRSGDISVSVTPVSLEEHFWKPQHPEIYSRAEVERQTGAYASARTALIAPQVFSFPAGLLADMEEAALALADFDSYAQRRLGMTNPALGPMSAILLRTESASSSRIEQLTTSAKQLALAEIGVGDKANAREVIGNVRAMEAALALAGDISAESILAMHRELLRDSHSLSRYAGVWREQLVWIGRGDAGPLLASFIAPQHRHIPGAIADLVAFVRRKDLPTIAQIALAHAQFESIHPFVDGNGRTGRALAQAMLRSLGMTRNTTVPISAGLLVNTDTYFAALEEFRSGNAGPIIQRFSQAARYAALTGRELVDALASELEQARAALSGVRSQARVWDVVPLLIGQPVINAKYVKDHLGLNDVTVLRALDVLVDRGVLIERTGAKRNRVWAHRGILDVLDDYAARVHRR